MPKLEASSLARMLPENLPSQQAPRFGGITRYESILSSTDKARMLRYCLCAGLWGTSVSFLGRFEARHSGNFASLESAL